MASSVTVQLRDIKPLIEIPDSSVYLYWGLIFLVSLLVIMVGYWFYRKVKREQKINLEKEYLERLNTIDWDSAKQAAYRATHYGRLLAADERREEIFSQLLPLLEKYKYKKETQRVDDETLRQFELYRRICNESV